MDSDWIAHVLFDEEEAAFEGWDRRYASISEFIQDLDEEADLAHEGSIRGCVLYERHHHHHHHQLHQQQILTLLSKYASRCDNTSDYMVQFWGVTRVHGSHHYLSTEHRPFLVDHPNKGFSLYRKLCRNHVYDVDVVGWNDEEQLGGVGRAYRSKNLESTPDLRLYSTQQFLMRDEAARCGFRGYVALPLFDSYTNQCFGVLEVLRSGLRRRMKHLLSTLDAELQIAGLRSTHSYVSISGFPQKMQPEREIRDILQLIVATVPRLYLAQVWVPCKQCISLNTNLGCMELASFITSKNNIVNSRHRVDEDMDVYLDACEFHNLQLGLDTFNSSNLCDMSISKNPLAHYAQRARISHSFAVSLPSLNNRDHFYLIQFFLQPKFREDGYSDSSLHLLLRILRLNLKSFKLVLLGKLLEESQKPHLIDYEATDSLEVISSYKQKLSKPEFTTYLEMVDSRRLQPSSTGGKGWVIHLPTVERLLVHIPIRKKIENLMKNQALHYWGEEYWIVQFWAPKMEENRCYLETSDQPYAVGCLAKGLASYRKKCTRHRYFVGEEAKEEELGPPGRVFKNKHPEITPDLFYYTTQEFPLRNYAMHCCTRPYFALPVFDDLRNEDCMGVLEFLGFQYYDIEEIREQVRAANLCSDHVNFPARLILTDEQHANILYRKEVTVALALMCNSIPQLHMANAWIFNVECISNLSDLSVSCFELAVSTNDTWIPRFKGRGQVYWTHIVDTGLFGMLFGSEDRACFCRNLSAFSIADQPLLHFQMSERCDICFAMTLKSPHTIDFYVIEFFLYPGPTSYGYLQSFLNNLLPIMKNELTSFKMIHGKELGEALVIAVIEFCEANKLGPSGSEQTDVFPVKFRSVLYYTRKMHQRAEEQQKDKHTIAASDLKKMEIGKRKTRLHLTLEALKPHFGKKLKDVAEELGVGRSTIKRACREYGISRWPSQAKYKNNPSLFEREGGRDSQQDTMPSTSNIQPVDTSLNQNVTHANVESTEKVIIKVKYKQDIIKFELCLSLGLAKLTEEVSTSLNLEKGTFRLKYLDEDGDEILLARDGDLQLCQKSHIKMGKTFIQLMVWK